TNDAVSRSQQNLALHRSTLHCERPQGRIEGASMIMAANMEDRVKNLLFASVAAVALLGGSANAADLARPAPIYAPAPVLVPLFTWTGCYVGGNVGGVWAMSDWNDAILGDFGSSSATGALGGLQAGCNYQVSRWVFGIQADYDWTNA